MKKKPAFTIQTPNPGSTTQVMKITPPAIPGPAKPKKIKLPMLKETKATPDDHAAAPLLSPEELKLLESALERRLRKQIEAIMTVMQRNSMTVMQRNLKQELRRCLAEIEANRRRRARTPLHQG